MTGLGMLRPEYPKRKDQSPRARHLGLKCPETVRQELSQG